MAPARRGAPRGADRGQPARPGRAPLRPRSGPAGRARPAPGAPAADQRGGAGLPPADRGARARAPAPSSASRPPTRPATCRPCWPPRPCLGADAGDLEAAQASGLVRVVGDRLELRHPLARSALHRGTPYPLRQAAHRALADVLTDEADADRRAWHLAATAVAPDDEAADALERDGRAGPGAQRARGRRGGAGARRPARLGSRRPRAADGRRGRVGPGRRPGAPGAGPGGRGGRRRSTTTACAPTCCASWGRPSWRAGAPREAHALLLAAADALEGGAPDRLLDLLLIAAEAAIMGGDRDGVLEAARRAEPLALGGRRLGAQLARGRRDGAARRGGRGRAHAPPAGGQRRRHARPAHAGVGGQRRGLAGRSGPGDRAPVGGRRRARARGAFATLAVALLRRGGLMAARGLTREALADGEEGLRLTEEAGPRQRGRPEPRGAGRRGGAARGRRGLPARGRAGDRGGHPARDRPRARDRRVGARHPGPGPRAATTTPWGTSPRSPGTTRRDACGRPCRCTPPRPT